MRHAKRPQTVVETIEPRLLFSSLPPGFAESLVAGGLGTPTAMDVLPDGRVLVATQTGDLRVVKNGMLLPKPFVHLNVDSSVERGLLGVTHDPNFASNGFIYLYHTVPAHNGAPAFNEVTRFTASGDVARAGSKVDILQLNPLGPANHNGGALHFGADGMLYIGVGENGNPANAQTLSNLLGKVLRIDVSSIVPGDPINDVQKLIPPDNPFVGVASGINQAIDALGFRNPFTFAVEPGTGTIFVNDVGENTSEEIDRLVPGGNYGWNITEGFATSLPPTGLGPGTYQDPLLAYNHVGGPAGGGIAIVGGVFYDPPAGAANPFPASYDGKYFYQDLGFEWTRVFDPASPGSLSSPDTSTPFESQGPANQVALAMAPDGSLYQLAQGGGGQLLKITFNAAAATQGPTPSIKIITGLHNGKFNAGVPIRFTLSATDPTDGKEPPSRFTYRIDYLINLNQTPGGIDQPFLRDTPNSPRGTFTPATTGPYTQPDVLYRIIFTVTDSQGLSTTITRDVFPNTSRLIVRSTPPGLTVSVDNQPIATPTTIPSVAGFKHLLSAPAGQTSGSTPYTFVQWSDGIRNDHLIRATERGVVESAIYRKNRPVSHVAQPPSAVISVARPKCISA